LGRMGRELPGGEVTGCLLDHTLLFCQLEVHGVLRQS